MTGLYEGAEGEQRGPFDATGKQRNYFGESKEASCGVDRAALVASLTGLERRIQNGWEWDEKDVLELIAAVRALLESEAKATGVIRLLLAFVENMRVPQTVADAALQILKATRPIEAAKQWLVDHAEGRS